MRCYTSSHGSTTGNMSYSNCSLWQRFHGRNIGFWHKVLVVMGGGGGGKENIY